MKNIFKLILLIFCISNIAGILALNCPAGKKPTKIIKPGQRSYSRHQTMIWVCR